MRIQELEQITGMDRATIRFYEKEDLITPKRSENGYRDYTAENAAELKKIRLLRQLGMSVFTIRQLQQGSASFSEILTQQVNRLSDQIEENKRAKAVCQTICDDGAAYTDLDADHYLTLFEQMQTQEPKFREHVPRECHPWRRWFARLLDYWWLGTLVSFTITVVLRVRPLPNDFESVLIAVLTGALLIPIEAWSLSRWATTPGKFAMGIRVVSVNGSNLTYREALNRAWSVYQNGMWFCIPTLELIPQLRQYLRLTGRSLYRFASKADIPDPEEMTWDENTEIIYESTAGKRRLILAGLIAATLVTVFFTAVDGMKPKYRSNELTVAQFAENYNQTMTFLHNEGHMFDTMNPDGSLTPYDPNNAYVIYVDPAQSDLVKEFQFETEGGIIKSVTLHKSLLTDDTTLIFQAMGAEHVALTITALLSTPGCSLGDYLGIIEELRAYQEQESAKFMFRDRIEVSWTIDAKNCVKTGTYYITEESGIPSSINHQFTVRFP